MGTALFPRSQVKHNRKHPDLINSCQILRRRAYHIKRHFALYMTALVTYRDT